MKRRKTLKILAFVVTGYMLVALIWWAILLQKQNKELDALYQMTNIESPAYDYDRKRQMILGEATVFGIALVLGMWLIYRSYSAQVRTEKNKANFLLSVTHELRSPLTGISLNLETLKKTSQLSQIAGQSLSYAQEETQRLKVLVENLLSSKEKLTGVNADLVKLESVNMVDLITQVNTNHYPTARVIVNVGPGNPIINTEKESIITIYRNLLDNAIKYSPEHAEIFVDLTNTDSQLNIAVKDAATQIPQSEFDSIFNAFHRLEDENIRTSKGIGLGLHLARQAADRLSASISVSHHDKGNLFTLSIPYRYD